ncbi:hypothetical protein [Roseovarius atlanticus]|uniref:hypothetical protein n=1 Tax=Roseovarius atlanticus TaxID=1641875 RepID=UPI001C97C238|nr:hypothetical protein [Roseovarius atlanticus]MBY5988189.1 hypothetical protein [Roseovarius atlanticus]MBY6123580.1 hypothetical protein [Roseovarius atlanticus]MBY6148075.1 hypothetical protein [Roseovarius atlanticus]
MMRDQDAELDAALIRVENTLERNGPDSTDTQLAQRQLRALLIRKSRAPWISWGIGIGLATALIAPYMLLIPNATGPDLRGVVDAVFVLAALALAGFASQKAHDRIAGRALAKYSRHFMKVDRGTH